MTEERISVIEAAKRLGKHRKSLPRILKRLGITPSSERRSEHGGQATAFITLDDFEMLSQYVSDGECCVASENGRDTSSPSPDQGFFYVIQLEPELDPGRFKVGFAVNLPDRLRVFQCAAPFATLIATWPFHRSWEKTAIDSVTPGSENLHTEVFRTFSLDSIIKRCSEFFSLMPDSRKCSRTSQA